MATVSLSFEPELERYARRRAKHLGMELTEYFRFCMLSEGVFAGDSEAFTILRRRALAKVRVALSEVLQRSAENPA